MACGWRTEVLDLLSRDAVVLEQRLQQRPLELHRAPLLLRHEIDDGLLHLLHLLVDLGLRLHARTHAIESARRMGGNARRVGGNA